MRRRRPAEIERAGSADLMFAALQRGLVPQQFGAVLVLEPGEGFDAALVTETLADRVRAVPRLRQRLMKVPLGCGRAVWVDDPSFTIHRHIEYVTCPSPGDEPALLDVAAMLIMDRLPMDRPLWRATVVTGLVSGRVAIVLVVQHALADGIGGLAVLGALVDGAPPAVRRDFPIPPPSLRRLAADALLTRIRALRPAPRRIRAAINSLRLPHGPRIGRAAPCSLLAATGDHRRLVVARARIEDVRAVAHRHRATVNDVVLSAIASALHTCLERLGEQVDAIVVGVPVAMRRTATARELGNRLGEIRAAMRRSAIPCSVWNTLRKSRRTARGWRWDFPWPVRLFAPLLHSASTTGTCAGNAISIPW